MVSMGRGECWCGRAGQRRGFLPEPEQFGGGTVKDEEDGMRIFVSRLFEDDGLEKVACEFMLSSHVWTYSSLVALAQSKLGGSTC